MQVAVVIWPCARFFLRVVRVRLPRRQAEPHRSIALLTAVTWTWFASCCSTEQTPSSVTTTGHPLYIRYRAAMRWSNPPQRLSANHLHVCVAVLNRAGCRTRPWGRVSAAPGEMSSTLQPAEQEAAAAAPAGSAGASAGAPKTTSVTRDTPMWSHPVGAIWSCGSRGSCCLKSWMCFCLLTMWISWQHTHTHTDLVPLSTLL